MSVLPRDCQASSAFLERPSGVSRASLKISLDFGDFFRVMTHSLDSMSRYFTRASAKKQRLNSPDHCAEDLISLSCSRRVKQPSEPTRPLVSPRPELKLESRSRGKDQKSAIRLAHHSDREGRPPQLQERRSNRPDSQVRVADQPKVRNKHTRGHIVSSLSVGRKQDKVSNWLGGLESGRIPVKATQAELQAYPALRMASSSSINTTDSAITQEATRTDASTAKKSEKNITFLENLEFRGVLRRNSEDRKLQELGLDKMDNVSSDHIAFKEFTDFVAMLEVYTRSVKKAIKERAEENGFYEYDALRQNVCEWRPLSTEYRRFTPIPIKYFEWDRNHCSRPGASEADFQRTIMASIIDRFDFQRSFDFTCEEQWSVSPKYTIPARRKVPNITQPRPDLAISFNRAAITKLETVDYPPELGKCLHPGSNGDERWFPFFFMEAKRGDASLSEAFKKNLASASQAIFNIFQWMRLAPELEERFFKDVRVFSMDINSKNVLLRMHRAERGRENQLLFKFTEVIEVPKYDRIQICHIVKTVLLDYADTVLRQVLSQTYETVAQIGPSSEIGRKRKTTGTETTSRGVGRDESSQDTAVLLQPPETGLSFDAAEIQLAETGQPSKRSKLRQRSKGAADRSG